MRKNFGAKAICYPMPVFIIGTYNADGTPNAMNAAWGGISEEEEISICVDSGHKTAENILARKAFRQRQMVLERGGLAAQVPDGRPLWPELVSKQESRRKCAEKVA